MDSALDHVSNGPSSSAWPTAENIEIATLSHQVPAMNPRACKQSRYRHA